MVRSRIKKKKKEKRQEEEEEEIVSLDHSEVSLRFLWNL